MKEKEEKKGTNNGDDLSLLLINYIVWLDIMCECVRLYLFSHQFKLMMMPQFNLIIALLFSTKEHNDYFIVYCCCLADLLLIN